LDTLETGVTPTPATGSRAKITFDSAICDAKHLLDHFKRMSAKPPPPPEAEVLKRAGLVMACTAWETYVEDRVRESLDACLAAEGETLSSRFVRSRLDEELKKFHNPTSEKTRKLFVDYLAIDVTPHWHWNGWDEAKVRKTLDELLKTRGDVVHRSKAPPASLGGSEKHVVTKESLERTIRFFKMLVDATERAFACRNLEEA
jgi:hypothetical protein